MNNRRMATVHNRRRGGEREYFYTIIATFCVGAMLGAVMCLGLITTGVIAL
jgi:hypothetical protein